MSTTYTGVVAAANPKGIRLDGHDEWLNYSKFATDIIPAERGQSVTVTVDAKGFIRTLQPLSGGVAPVAGASDAPCTDVSRRSEPSTKDRTITRLAVLKAAAEYAASKPQSKSSEVLAIAESWERWVNRGPDDLDLTEAF